MSAAGASIPFQQLINGPHVHGSLYRDPDCSQRELEAIWYKVWVYIGHESEIPQPGDFVRRQIGLQPVIMMRGRRRQRRRLLQSLPSPRQPACATASTATPTSFRCPYHGWTYANDRRAARADIRGRLRRQSPPRGFQPHAAAARRTPIAAWCSQASARPASRLTSTWAGSRSSSTCSWTSRRPARSTSTPARRSCAISGNWKLLPENSLEGDYHGPFIHRVAFELHSRQHRPRT